MRFINLVISLSSIASVVSELAQGVPSHGDLMPELNDRANKITSSSTSSKSTLATTFSTSTKTTSTITSTSAKITSTKSSSSSSISSATATSTDAASCPAKRALESSQLTAKTNGEWLLYEDQWITALKVQSGDKIAVTDVKRCTAVFFWNSANIPSTYHIYCGNDIADAKTAFGDLVDMGSEVKPVHIHIATNGQSKYEEMVKLVQNEFDLDKEKDISALVYQSGDLADGMRYRYEAVAGTLAVTRKEITASSCSRQP